MKLRAKYQGVSQPVEVENDQCRLQDLQRKTAEIFALDPRLVHFWKWLDCHDTVS